MQNCPECGSVHVHRSKARTRLESVLKYFTSKRLHRCLQCTWRGWGLETLRETPRAPEDPRADPVDLALLNISYVSRAFPRRQSFAATPQGPDPDGLLPPTPERRRRPR